MKLSEVQSVASIRQVSTYLPSDEVAPTFLECVILLGESISRSRTILRSAAVQCS